MISNNTNENESEAILRLDVNIDDTNRIEKLEIIQGQDITQAVSEFCMRFNIPDLKRERLLKIVEERLAMNNSSSQENENPMSQDETHPVNENVNSNIHENIEIEVTSTPTTHNEVVKDGNDAQSQGTSGNSEVRADINFQGNENIENNNQSSQNQFSNENTNNEVENHKNSDLN